MDCLNQLLGGLTDMWKQFKVYEVLFIPPTLIQPFCDASLRRRCTCQRHQDFPLAGPDWALRMLTCWDVKHGAPIPALEGDSAFIVKELNRNSGKLFSSLSSATRAPCDFSQIPEVTCMSHVCHMCHICVTCMSHGDWAGTACSWHPQCAHNAEPSTRSD